MFGFGKPIFSGSISDNDGNSAAVELDGSGRYEESRKVWRCRLNGGRVSDKNDLSITIGGRIRKARFSADACNSNYGYIEMY